MELKTDQWTDGWDRCQPIAIYTYVENHALVSQASLGKLDHATIHNPRQQQYLTHIYNMAENLCNHQQFHQTKQTLNTKLNTPPE